MWYVIMLGRKIGAWKSRGGGSLGPGQVKGLRTRMNGSQGGRQQLRSLGGRKTKAKRKASSSLAKSCFGSSSLPLLGIRSCN
jgi:hypothetical protein